MFMLHIAERGKYTNVQRVNLLLSARTLFDKKQKYHKRDDFRLPKFEKQIITSKKLLSVGNKSFLPCRHLVNVFF